MPAALATAAPSTPGPAATIQHKGKPKGAGKGPKGKKEGKGAGKTKGIENQVCYRYQRGKCTETFCPRKHECNRCGSPKHGEKDCKEKKVGTA